MSKPTSYGTYEPDHVRLLLAASQEWFSPGHLADILKNALLDPVMVLGRESKEHAEVYAQAYLTSP